MRTEYTALIGYQKIVKLGVNPHSIIMYLCVYKVRHLEYLLRNMVKKRSVDIYKHELARL